MHGSAKVERKKKTCNYPKGPKHFIKIILHIQTKDNNQSKDERYVFCLLFSFEFGPITQ